MTIYRDRLHTGHWINAAHDPVPTSFHIDIQHDAKTEHGSVFVVLQTDSRKSRVTIHGLDAEMMDKIIYSAKLALEAFKATEKYEGEA